MSAEQFTAGLPSDLQTPQQLAMAWYRLKLADRAASLQHQQTQRQSVARLVQLNQNKAFGMMPDAGLPEGASMAPGGIHIGDIVMPQPQPPVMAAAPAAPPQQASTLTKLAIGAAAAAAGLGAGLGLPQLLDREPPAVVQPAEPHVDTDTIGVLEPDRE